MDEIASLSHFNPEIVAVSNELGYLHTKTNKWYGMMKIMNDNVADVGVALFTMSSTRMTAVDYAIPLAKGRCNLYARLPDNTEVRWITYFQVFDKDAWTAIGASILIFSFLVHLIKNGFQRAFIQSFSEDFIKIWGIFSLQSPSDDESSSISIKIIYFSTFFTSTILNVIYSASITSYIAVLSPELPFSTFGEFLRDDSYDLILIQGSRDHSFILSNGSKLTPLQARLRKSCCLPNYAYEGFQQACAEKTAFYTDDVKYDSMQNFLPCKLGAVSMELVEYLSFVMTKNSPYKRAVNYNILRLMDHGILHRLRTKYFRKYAELSNVQPSVITFKEVWPIIVIWIIGPRSHYFAAIVVVVNAERDRQRRRHEGIKSMYDNSFEVVKKFHSTMLCAVKGAYSIKDCTISSWAKIE
ncbi:probable glutamate receptor [Phymastichus coffea]|uniref:probable glutamate receptor n=1 Tax=Phymastichus coffea TaxID=108790 RepID=UPI00273AE1FD|nr:probable glutamate receptor [Phymastichus coffea]